MRNERHDIGAPQRERRESVSGGCVCSATANALQRRSASSAPHSLAVCMGGFVDDGRAGRWTL